MSDKKHKKQKGKAKSGKDALEKAVADFMSGKRGPLPEEIDEAALGSGEYPYDEKLSKKIYERELEALQIELAKAKAWITKTGARYVVVFEGRDSAGKGGAIHRLTQHLNPRDVRVVALPKPTDAEQGQWYFQRYVRHMPTKGEIVIFDRSWYNRGAVEPVLGFCKPEQTDVFLEEAPRFESMLVRDGIVFVKLFLTIGREMQLKRLYARDEDPLKRWKLSSTDRVGVGKWNEYSEAYDRMLAATDKDGARWRIIKANDKLRSRLAVIREILSVIPYEGKDEKLVEAQDPQIALSAAKFLKQGGEE